MCGLAGFGEGPGLKRQRRSWTAPAIRHRQRTLEDIGNAALAAIAGDSDSEASAEPLALLSASRMLRVPLRYQSPQKYLIYALLPSLSARTHKQRGTRQDENGQVSQHVVKLLDTTKVR